MPEVNVSQSKARKRTNNIFILSLMAWTATIAGLFFISYGNEYDMALSSARLSAVHSLRKDLLYRKWASGHVGVYVPVTETNQPNPHLSSVPERDVETTTGKKLTLINSGCMNDQIFQLGLNEYGIYGHNTSLNPINPQHSPDDWERKALLSLQNGGNEYFGLDTIGGVEHLRYMVPMTIRDACLNCHNNQGYKVGDLGGATVVSVPWNEFQSNFIKEAKTVGGIYGIVWFLGLLGMFGARGMITSEISRQDSALEALANSERMLNTVLQATSVGIGLIKDRVIQWTNDAMSPMTGYSADELCGHQTVEFYATEEEYERTGATMYAEIAIQNRSMVETRFRKKDGTIFEVLMNLSAVDKTDLSAGSVFVIMDISESKKMARQLQENIERMDRAELAAKFGNWELDLNTKKVRGSKGALHIYGVQQDEMDLEVVQKFPLPEYRAGLDEVMASAIHYIKPYDIEYKLVRQSDNEIVDIHAIGEFNPTTNVLFGVIQDITEQKKAQEALLASETKYRMLAENMTDVIWSSDLNLRLDYASPSTKNLLGYEPEDVLGKTIFEMTTPELKEKFEPVVQERVKALKEFKTMPSISYDFELTRKDGSSVWIELISSPSIDSNGRLLGFQGVARDISQRKEAQEALLRSEAKYRMLAENMMDVIWSSEPNLALDYVSPSVKELLGYESEEIRGTIFFDLLTPESRDRVQPILLQRPGSRNVGCPWGRERTPWRCDD